MTSTEHTGIIEIDPIEIARLNAVPAVAAAWALYQEARAQRRNAAGGAESGRKAVEAARAAWVNALREAQA